MRQRVARTAAVLLIAVAACGGDDDAANDQALPPASEPADEPSDSGPESVSDPDDADGDGATDDNCPGVANPRQTDSDGDGIGDRCETDLERLPEECGIVDEANALGAALTGDSGDSEDETLCISTTSLPLIRDEVPGVEVVIIEEEYAVIDVSPIELEEIRDLGIVIRPVDRFAILDRDALIAARLNENPEALATVDREALATLSANVLERIPADVFATQDDDTLTAIPDEFWTRADQRVLDLVGDRLVRLDPKIFELRPFETIPDRRTIGD